ncbi:hypothetical protein STEG23_020598 [Scotinomys teguina]
MKEQEGYKGLDRQVGHGSPTPCDAEPPCACAGSTYSAAAAGLLCGGVWPAPIDKHKPWLEPTYHRIVTENNNTVLLNLSPIALDKDSPLRFAVQALDSGYYNYTATNNVDNLAKKTVNLLVQSLKNATFQITPKVIKENRNIQLCQDLKLLCHLDAVTRRSYEIHLIPYTTFGANFFGANFGMTSQVIHYTEAFNSPNLSDSTCHFEDEKICDYTQGLTDNFDWTQQNALTQNPKCSPNTGPPTDINGTPEGYYMFIETSKPQELGNHARLDQGDTIDQEWPHTRTQQHPDTFGGRGPRSTQTLLEEEDQGTPRHHWTKRTQEHPDTFGGRGPRSTQTPLDQETPLPPIQGRNGPTSMQKYIQQHKEQDITRI